MEESVLLRILNVIQVVLKSFMLKMREAKLSPREIPISSLLVMEKILLLVFQRDWASNSQLLRRGNRELRERRLNSKRMKRMKRTNDQMNGLIVFL